MALTQDTPYVEKPGEYNDLAVKASTLIYQGAMVGIEAATGYARGLVAQDPFAGHAFLGMDNSGGADGDKKVRVRRGSYVLQVNLAVSQTDVASKTPVYASDDGTLTLTSTSNTLVGHVEDRVTASVCQVRFNTTALT